MRTVDVKVDGDVRLMPGQYLSATILDGNIEVKNLIRIRGRKTVIVMGLTGWENSVYIKFISVAPDGYVRIDFYGDKLIICINMVYGGEKIVCHGESTVFILKNIVLGRMRIVEKSREEPDLTLLNRLYEVEHDD